jgi:hypothetical protein
MSLILLEQLTKLNEEAQNKNLRQFAKLDNEMRIEVLKKQKSIFHKMKKETDCDNNPLLTLASLILAIDVAINKFDDIDHNIIKMRSNNSQSKKKQQKLLTLWAVVKRLKTKENLSFRQISKYLKKYHRFEISYSLIYQSWKKLETNTNKEGI